MRQLIAIIILGFTVLVDAAENPIMEAKTQILHIPILEFQKNGVSLYFEADLQASANLSTFTLIKGKKVSPPKNINLEGIGGDYSGVLIAYEEGTTTKIEPFESCPPVPFNPGDTTISFVTDGMDIEMSLTVFPDLECNLSGTLNDLAEGAFECSDFNDGIWESDMIQPINAGEILALKISFTGQGCSFDTSFTGLKN